MKILVTRGVGFIGSNFIAKVMKEELGDVLALDKLTYAGHFVTIRE